VVARLAAWQAELRDLAGDSYRWVAPAALHLTLRFLGEQADDGPARQALAAACADRAPFAVVVRGGGAFPRLSAPRTIWAGVEDPSDALWGLATAVEAACIAHGLGAEDKPFVPHLTVARARAARAPARLVAALEASRARCFGVWQVAAVDLIHSTLTSSGPVYRTLLTAALNGG
jgi:2'-5' RNA ligase